MCVFVAPSVRWHCQRQQPVYGGAKINAKKIEHKKDTRIQNPSAQNNNRYKAAQINAKGLRFICKYNSHNNCEIEIEMQIKTINKNANMSIKVKCKFVSCFECNRNENRRKSGSQKKIKSLG